MNLVKTKNITLEIGDGSSMSAFTAMPEGKGTYPGILIFQEAFGVNSYIRDVAERFAKLGFIAIAPELFHRTASGYEGSYADFEGTRIHILALTEEGLLKDIEASYNWLKKNPGLKHEEIASAGFCLGGRVSFLANTNVKLKAAVSFYGSNIPSLLNRIDKISAPQLMFWGGLDKHIGDDQIAAVTGAMKEKGKNFVSVVFSNADHGFFCDVRKSYNPEAAKNAWALVISFLETYLDWKQ